VKKDLAIFEGHEIRRIYDEKTETWFFSVVDIIQVLTQQPDFQTARKYWNKLKERLGKEGSQLVTNCHRFKLAAEDGKQRLTDVANAETLLRLVQSVPSPKAEPIKLWLAKVGYGKRFKSCILVGGVLPDMHAFHVFSPAGPEVPSRFSVGRDGRFLRWNRPCASDRPGGHEACVRSFRTDQPSHVGTKPRRDSRYPRTSDQRLPHDRPGAGA
jgi:hypothetical protein